MGAAVDSRPKFWNSASIASRIYSGRGSGVIVRENGTTKSLSPRVDGGENQSGFTWGSAGASGKRLALALLADALENDQRASALAEVFSARVISILPDRWTMTRARVLAYADLLAREPVRSPPKTTSIPAKMTEPPITR